MDLPFARYLFLHLSYRKFKKVAPAGEVEFKLLA